MYCTVEMRADVDADDATLHGRQMFHVALQQPVTDASRQCRQEALRRKLLFTRTVGTDLVEYRLLGRRQFRFASFSPVCNSVGMSI